MSIHMLARILTNIYVNEENLPILKANPKYYDTLLKLKVYTDLYQHFQEIKYI